MDQDRWNKANAPPVIKNLISSSKYGYHEEAA